MGKRWTEDEEKIMTTHYTTAETVDEVAQMLGRPVFAVFKKGQKMGLKRPPLHEVSIGRLTSALSKSPRSSAEIAEMLGMGTRSVNAVLRRAREEGLCRIAGFRPTGTRGKDAALWVSGSGANATNERPVEAPLARKPAAKTRSLPEKSQKCANQFRALSMAFYGLPGIAEESRHSQGRVHLMETEEDEREAA